MNAESITAYCIAKANVTSGFPFRPQTMVFKKGERAFCLVRLDQHPLTFNVKCDPEYAIELREKYPAVKEGYHMNKKHWNTVIVDGSLNDDLIKSFIDQSYNLV